MGLGNQVANILRQRHPPTSQKQTFWGVGLDVLRNWLSGKLGEVQHLRFRHVSEAHLPIIAGGQLFCALSRVNEHDDWHIHQGTRGKLATSMIETDTSMSLLNQANHLYPGTHDSTAVSPVCHEQGTTQVSARG